MLTFQNRDYFWLMNEFWWMPFLPQTQIYFIQKSRSQMSLSQYFIQVKSMAHIICVSRYGFVVIVFPDKNMIRDWKWNNSISYWYDDLCSIADRKLCYNTDYDSDVILPHLQSNYKPQMWSMQMAFNIDFITWSNLFSSGRIFNLSSNDRNPYRD